MQRYIEITESIMVDPFMNLRDFFRISHVFANLLEPCALGPCLVSKKVRP